MMSQKKGSVGSDLGGFVNYGFVGCKEDSRVQSRENCFESKVKKDEYYVKPLCYFSLFQYATGLEKFCILLAVLLAIFSGCVPPVINVLYGEFCNLMIDRQYPTNSTSTKTFLLEWFGGGRILRNASMSERREALVEDSRAWGLGCAFLTFLQFMSSMVSVFLLSFMAYRQVSRIKVLFFKSVLCKDLSWFDTQMDGNFAGQASDNLNKLEAGIGGVIGVFAYLLVIFSFGVIISLLYGWELTLAIIFAIPISFGTSSVVVKFQSKLAAKELASYARAGTVAEEVFSSIRTVVAFEGENKEIERFSYNIEKSKNYGIKRGLASGISNGISWFVIYCSYAVAFVFGVRLIQASRESGDNQYTPAVLLIVFFGIVTALTNLGFASAHIETFSVACGAAASVFDVIKTKSNIDPSSKEGSTGENCMGEIEFKNVYFEYPARPTVRILEGVNLKIKAGELVAIVGGSGAGKSTILQLVQRLYDPSKGSIYLDGCDIKSLKVSWLRQQLGVVGQEPMLFNTTIRDNILYGDSSASDEDVVEAAKKANAHDFITKLKEGYDTVIGQRGSTLSGGQKQRIAIARALIRNPKILILDEATSALDANSEKVVQAALDKAAEGRTTLIVTHKLSTVVNAHRIIVLDGGVVAEEGTHDELLAANGIYKRLLQTQSQNTKERKPRNVRLPTPRIIYEDTVSLPPVPRSRLGSVSSLAKGKKGKPLDKSEQYKKISYLELIKWSKSEWILILVGTLASVVGGAALPIVCILFGNLFGLLTLEDSKYMITQTDIYAIALVAVGIVAGISVFLQMYCFSKAGMKLSSRLRIKAFTCIIHQDIGYFDDENNKVGALCLRLSQDPSEIQGTVGIRLGVLMQAFSTMTIGIVSSFFFSWKMTLVTLATIPFVFTGVYLESLFLEVLGTAEGKSMENATKIAVEVISNIKAVASLGKEFFFIERYSEALKEARKRSIKRSWLRGFAFAIGQTAPFFGYSLSLWYGGILVANENLHYKYVLMVSELLIFGAWTLGQSIVIGPSFGESKAAAGRLKYIFLNKPKITDGSSSLAPDIGQDGITYSMVNFNYPTRPGTKVLDDFNVHVKAGESVAVMGPSGSGKSTVVQLLLRYYDPTSGTVSINDVNIADCTLSSLRKNIGLVSQEPVLFDRTIEENIAYGDNSRAVSLSEVIVAAEAANIHSFIVTLPLGYDTKLGAAGTQLSGGQKQRIAIARALVRNPKILLLDEATSALDPQSENVVQDALDKASSGRTTITIAHRLGAVRNADVIYVVEKGRIKEYGTHEELMKLQGIYYSMHDGDDGKDRNIPETSEK